MPLMHCLFFRLSPKYSVAWPADGPGFFPCQQNTNQGIIPIGQCCRQVFLGIIKKTTPAFDAQIPGLNKLQETLGIVINGRFQIIRIFQITGT